MTKKSKLNYERTPGDLLLKLEGVAIAKRGQPNSDQAGTWIALEPGYEIIDSLDGDSILINQYGVRVH
jgi:hypothetical protein